ncbi:MAG: NAD-binding protein [Candidatus Altiarchaeota archaeon]|nr:NAD-binding protein [Candidatus Altiarchaeota archaeon]
MYVIIIGCGNIGKSLATHLISEGNEVVIVENDEERGKALAESMDVVVIHGDGSSTDILKDAGVERSDAVAVLTADDNTNLTICQMLKKFNVPKIVARVNQPEKKDLYVGLEITASISIVAAAVSQIKNALTKDKGRSMMSIAGGNAEVIEIKQTNEKLDGKKIKDIGLPFGALIGVVYRNGEVLIGTDDTIVRTGDVLTVITKTEVIQDVTTILK